MWVYIVLFAVVLWLVYRDGIGKKITNRQFVVIMICLTLFVGLADMLGGYDRYIYSELFDEIADMTKQGFYYSYTDSMLFNLYVTEWGYGWLNVILSFITKNRYIFIMIITCIIYFNLYRSLIKYTSNHAVALMFFLALLFFFTFTYIRQVLAVTFVWYGIKYILERRFLRFLIVVILASSFHNAAVMFLLMYFIPNIKYDKGGVLWFVGFVFVAGLSGLPSTLYDMYSTVTETERNSGLSEDSTARLAYIFESSVILFLIFSNYDKLFKNEKTTLMTNMAIVFSLILVLFYKSENGGRLSWCFMIGVISTLTTIYSILSKRSLVRLGLNLICMALYMRIVITWGILLYPYKTFLNPGIREGDFIEQNYEYDHSYDEDKFYRL